MKKYIHKVNYYETDRMGITHHSNYIRFMEEARIDFLNQIDFGYEKMEEQGIVSPVINVTCDYKKTTTFADVIEIEVKVEKVTSCKLFLQYVMTVNNETVCSASSVHCFLDSTGRPVILEKKYPDLFKTLMECLK